MSSDAELIRYKCGSISPGEGGWNYFNVIVEHGASLLRHAHDAVHGVRLAHDVPSEGEVAHRVGQVKVAAGKGLDVVHVDVVDGEGLAWRNMEAASHPVNF